MSDIAPKNILVRVPNWIGDAVMCLPALMDLRECFAKAHITVLARPTIVDVLRGQSEIDDVIVYEHQAEHRGIFGLLRLSRVIRKRAFDMAVLFQNAFEAAVLTVLANIPIRIGYVTDGRGWLLSQRVPLPQQQSLHQIRYYQQLVQAITHVPSKADVPKLVLAPNDQLVCQSQFGDICSS
jgi:heptosyltransferase-2